MSNPDPSWRVLCNDARDLSPIPDASVHAIITSVPYWGLRRYVDDDREIGREETLQEWIGNLVECVREWRRVLRDDGTLWINCGDSYANDAKGWRNCEGIKRKDMIGLPWRLAFALQADGWYFRSAICWAKGLDWTDAEREAQERIRDALAFVREQAAGSLWGLSKDLARALNKAERAVDRLAMSGAAMPESVTDRPTSAYEMLFLFSKSEWYFYDREAIRVPRSGNTHSRGEGSTPKGRAAEHTNIRANSSFHAATSGHLVASRNARNVWRIATKPSPSGGYQLSDGRIINHFASYPRALAARVILAATSEAGCCAKCGAPFKRVVETVQAKRLQGGPSPKRASINEGGRQSSALVNNTLPVTKTIAWVPTCRCYGEPIEADVPCPACNGTGIEHAYPRGNEPYKARALPGRHPGSINTDHDGKDFARPQPVGGPCPACLCPDCGGSGQETIWLTEQERVAGTAPIGSDRKLPASAWGNNQGKKETGEPCPTCDGLGATGRINGEIWPVDVLETWPRQPCTVHDPMAGTGQTGMAALDLSRSVILNDLSSDYCDLMRERLSVWPGDLGAARSKK
ncbi:MAG: hypothetical protein DRI81_00625 [Chloroflexi bacterium]|nr:MAG: hypothetical protein DRI81_00625 [Chloroflexota bacterium]